MKTIDIKNKDLHEEFYRFLNLDNEFQKTYKLNAQQNLRWLWPANKLKMGTI
jgi:hypothetical protein